MSPASPSVLAGLGGNDSLTGGASAVLLTGGAGNDILAGRDGDDACHFAPGDGQDRIA